MLVSRGAGVANEEQDEARFTTISGVPVRRLYTAADLPPDWSAGAPGEAPYTRGIHATGYRGKLWTMRQFSGFATPEETNARYRYLLANGGGGLSVAFDLPTLMGYDSDAAESEGEVGKCGVAIDSLEDMETLFSGIDLDSDQRFHDHQLARQRALGHVPGDGRETGRRLDQGCGHTAERHPQGISRKRSSFFLQHLRCGWWSIPSSSDRCSLRASTHLDQRLSHS